jgi:hypothetical protein
MRWIGLVGLLFNGAVSTADVVYSRICRKQWVGKDWEGGEVVACRKATPQSQD